VTHFVKYSQPRVYYHSVVEFDRETMRPLQYTAPFCFRRTAIEYSLGFDVCDGVATFIFSENDTAPGMIRVPLMSLRWISV
jgi:predicted ATP-grasp superfamily ATP-dependent carboligase